MNILIIAPDFKPLYGGVAEYTHRLALQLHQAKDHVIVLSERMKDDIVFDASCPYTVLRHDFRFIPSGPIMKYFKGYWWLRKFIHTHGPIDIIISNCRDLSSVTALAVSKSLKIPFVIFTHGLEINRKQLKEILITKLILQGARRVVCNSTFTQKLVQKYGVSKSRITLVPGAIAIDEYLASSCSRVDKAHLGDKHAKRRTIFTCGKLTERKGHDMVIKALPLILKNCRDAVYVIAGEGPREDTLRQIARKLGVEQNVVFKGRVCNAERKRLYRSCELFVMPCRELRNGDVEGFGLVFLEANAFCKPVIAGRSGGAIDAVEHKKTGYLVDPTNHDEIAAAITYLLKNPQIAAKMGKEGRKRVERAFTWQISGGKLRQSLSRLKNTPHLAAKQQ